MTQLTAEDIDNLTKVEIKQVAKPKEISMPAILEDSIAALKIPFDEQKTPRGNDKPRVTERKRNNSDAHTLLPYKLLNNFFAVDDDVLPTSASLPKTTVPIQQILRQSKVDNAIAETEHDMQHPLMPTDE